MVSQFGKEFNLDWSDKEAPKYSEFQKNLLKKCKKVTKLSEITKTSEIIINSQKFPIEFPINTCRVEFQPKERYEIIEEQINSAYPIIHERVIWLYLRFLEHKIKYEKNVYSDMDLIDFVQRLLTKRCVSFFQRYDKYLLISKETGTNGHTTVGSLKEKSPLFLKNCLSYDEIKLSALLSVSSHTEFINNGNRHNQGHVEKNKSEIERSGVIIGLIGARLVKRNFMEAQDIIISDTQNTKEHGYGKKDPSETGLKATKNDYRQMWNDFYNELDFIYNDVKVDNGRFHRLNANEIFDSIVMKKRYTISFDTLLLDAAARAFNEKKQAYIHVVGIGLGVWKCWKEQEKIFLATFAQRIKKLILKLNNISIIHFSYFNNDGFEEIKNGAIFHSDSHPNGGIKILVSKRNPHQKLHQPELENYLPVISYAWDGNALPGNEFWLKHLKSTSDSAAACSTLITELHNPHINTKRVNANNLHIASEEFGVLHISEYAEKILKML
ncbi:uncharacterized protein LOC129606900 isoform X2 [Condylostylus longicornis]|uniref:uncharacterized protein LOC129606900 isoform X2 n=1 Tax=Condylostylus longicornis TaxID=2530218 RepID=UPI00244DBB14|nr:uncharacterized protein LOC129606900 isoform X2 [Condylostylus longicornis]